MSGSGAEFLLKPLTESADASVLDCGHASLINLAVESLGALIVIGGVVIQIGKKVACPEERYEIHVS